MHRDDQTQLQAAAQAGWLDQALLLQQQFEHAAQALASQPGQPACCWHLLLRFGHDCLRNGVDPLALLQRLGSVGTVSARRTVIDPLPALQALDAEDCHLAIELRLQTECSAATIAQVFALAVDHCSVQILPADLQSGLQSGPPHSLPASRSAAPIQA